MRVLTGILPPTVVFAILVLFCGCSTVTMSRPLSEDPKPLDQKKFEGTWVANGGALTVRFSENGIAKFASVDWKDDEFYLVRGEMIVTHGLNRRFLSLRIEEDGKWMDSYLLLQYRFTDDGDLLVWEPNFKAFEEAINKGALQGAIRKEKYSETIAITSEPQVLLNFIDAREEKVLFEYQDPHLFKRVGSSAE
jgi:hypothetical protein